MRFVILSGVLSLIINLIFHTVIHLGIQVTWVKVVRAQDINQELTLKTPQKVDEKLANGWHPNLKIKANLTVGSSKSVVGQVDGDSNTFGGSLDSGLIYKQQQNEWRQAFNYSGATTRTASLPRYVKSADELKYSTIYLRSLESFPQIGPYARAELRTSVFRGEDVRAEEKDYVIRGNNTPLGSHSVYRLTDPFIPLTTQESVGFFAKLIERKRTKLEIRLGVGAIQVRTDRQLRLDDDAKTPDVIELSRLDNLSQMGMEYGLIFSGQWNENSDYSLVANFLTPIGTEIEFGKECYGCNSWNLTNIDLKAVLSSKVSDWMNFSYEYRALRQPEVLNAFQIQHGFALNFFYDLL